MASSLRQSCLAWVRHHRDRAPTRRPADSSGFTLIELMIALFIFAIGMLAVASMQGESIRGNSFSDLMTIANTLAEGKMEDLMGLSPTHDNLQDNNPANNDHLLSMIDTDGHRETGLDRDGNAGSGIFTRTWNVAKRDPADPNKVGYPADGLMTIVVVVEWKDQRGRHQVYASSIRDCPGGCPQP
jgi:type IV pilus modification protein PilV